VRAEGGDRGGHLCRVRVCAGGVVALCVHACRVRRLTVPCALSVPLVCRPFERLLGCAAGCSGAVAFVHAAVDPITEHDERTEAHVATLATRHAAKGVPHCPFVPARGALPPASAVPSVRPSVRGTPPLWADRLPSAC
jgi:hypothetical protein